jgi:hypothetical protein
MWRLIKFLFTGDGHLHRWQFVNVVYYQRSRFGPCNIVDYVKVCEICGAHKSGRVHGCSAETAADLNP